MNETLEKINKKLEPYHSLLTMLAFFSMLFIGAYKFIISPSDLRITTQNESISYPNSIGEYYDDLSTYVIKQDTLQAEATTVYSFLLKTTDFKKITLKNTSSKTLRGVKFKQINSDALTAWSVSSDFLTNKEELNLRANLIFDEMRQIIYFKNDVEIPPNSQINISIWGNFKPELINNNLIINYDGGDGHVEKSYTVNGLKGYFVNYSFEFIVILILIFIAVYYVGIKNLRKDDN
ncbi:hypothetical protein J2Q11_13660 [Tenacibaculum finnmarkense genomovar finnmarkense]|uniref:hypothetical protein n=1 Tax=Tenacibaculum finnmarkense TaxID=2781243 RepID=UPI001E2F7801|nr:hypothetical protein [Tenacibaculum finnmarkense]MCD8418772.1 hypothetical protein [Tenacibaculum finnmarkense genomovar finnmarkense]MCG8187070.1 hypothetical protein [Tenacibaculum finnmarkense genomovar finnmarkense]MCG8203620.1 hypothetical protein [Tenacibaculum finnmarkense genomovar finnmarkense]MCG8211103.1 hypothetical protein [Tenacibaculum finnmarkense genomovar finnmarkense]MCG8213858.1 hypothetical protein [Tenacibaculum finnmarkense genomovar finnmarkense]